VSGSTFSCNHVHPAGEEIPLREEKVSRFAHCERAHRGRTVFLHAKSSPFREGSAVASPRCISRRSAPRRGPESNGSIPAGRERAPTHPRRMFVVRRRDTPGWFGAASSRRDRRRASTSPPKRSTSKPRPRIQRPALLPFRRRRRHARRRPRDSRHPEEVDRREEPGPQPQVHVTVGEHRKPVDARGLRPPENVGSDPGDAAVGDPHRAVARTSRKARGRQHARDLGGGRCASAESRRKS
jgi:hypothetical protein